MKTTLWGLVVTTAAFGASSIYLWQELRQERAESEATARQLNARIAELEKAPPFAQRRMANAGNFAASPFGNGAGPPPPAPPAGATAEAKAGEPQPVWTQRGPDRSPAFQKMMHSQARVQNRRMYADVGTKLGLDKETTNKLIDLITDQQTSGFGFNDPELMNDPEAARRAFEERQRETQAAITDLLGPDKAQQLRDYQATIPARMEVDMMARQLEGSDTPLSDAQRKQLVDVYVEERQRVPVPEYRDGMDGADYAKLSNAWQEDYETRVNSQASSILTSDQLSAFNDMQQMQRDMREHFATVAPGTVQMRRGPAGGNMMYAAPVMSFRSVAVAEAPASEQKKP